MVRLDVMNAMLIYGRMQESEKGNRNSIAILTRHCISLALKIASDTAFPYCRIRLTTEGRIPSIDTYAPHLVERTDSSPHSPHRATPHQTPPSHTAGLDS